MAGSAQEPAETGHAETKPVSVKDREIRRVTRFPIFAVALIAAGCSLVPPYARPQVDVPTGWTSLTKAAGSGVQPRAGWWRSFSSPELNRLMDRGLTGNLNLQAAVARITQARGTAEIDAAPLWPVLSLAVTQDHSTGIKNSQTHQLLGQATYEIDFWGKSRAAAASGAALRDASAFDADTVAMTLSASLADTYFQILSLRERIALARSIAADARHVLSLIEIQRSLGTATDLQVAQQRATVATFEAAVPALQQQMDLAIHALAALTGQIPEGFAVTADKLGPLSRPDILPDLPTALLERRPDVRAAEARLVSANFDIGVARAAFFPSVSLTGSVGVGSKTLPHFFPATALADFGADLLQPLFQRGQLEGQLRVSRGRQIELVAAYRQAVLTAFQDVEDALSTLNQVRAQVAIETTAQTAARKAADLAQLQYSLGSADYLSVLTTEQSLYTAQDTLLQLKLLELRGIVGLYRALGGGFDQSDGPAVIEAHSAMTLEAVVRPDGERS